MFLGLGLSLTNTSRRGGGGARDDALLLESGDYLLLENGRRIEKEFALQSSYARLIPQHTLAGHGASPLSSMIDTGTPTQFDTEIIAGNPLHWQGLGNNKTSFPTPATDASCTDASYTLRVTAHYTGGATAQSDVTITRVTFWSPPAQLVTDMGAVLAADPIAPTRFYLVSTQAELNAVKTATGSNPAVVFVSRGLTARPTMIRTGWPSVAGWMTLTDENMADPSPLSQVTATLGQTAARIATVGTKCTRALNLDGGLFSAAAYVFQGAGPTIIYGAEHDVESGLEADSTDGFRVIGSTTWTYVGRCRSKNSWQNLFGGTTADIYLIGNEIEGFMQDAFYLQSSDSVVIEDNVVSGAGKLYEDAGLHQDAIQPADGHTINSLRIARNVFGGTPRYSFQIIFSGTATIGHVEIENNIGCGLAYQGVRVINSSTGFVRWNTFAAQPDAATPAPELGVWPGTVAPSIDMDEGGGSSAVEIYDNFVHGLIDGQAGQTLTDNLALGSVDRNLSVAVYFQDPITAPLDADTTPAEMAARLIAGYTPKVTLRLANGNTTYVGALKPGGGWNDGT